MELLHKILFVAVPGLAFAYMNAHAQAHDDNLTPLETPMWMLQIREPTGFALLIGPVAGAVILISVATTAVYGFVHFKWWITVLAFLLIAPAFAGVITKIMGHFLAMMLAIIATPILAALLWLAW